MSFLIAGAVIGGIGVAKAISGGVQKKKAKAAAAAAQAELESQKEAFKNLDKSNPYANLENTMEDLTVNQEEAQFVAEKQAQSQANILSDLRGAARKAAISIGQQEQANQMKEREQAAAIQKAERQGDIMTRNMKQQEVDTLMRMAGQDVTSSQQAVAQADQKMWSGITQAGMAVAGGVGGASGNLTSAEAFNMMQSGVQ